MELSFSYTPGGEGAPWVLVDLLVRADNALTTRLLLPSVAAGSAVPQLVIAPCWWSRSSPPWPLLGSPGSKLRYALKTSHSATPGLVGDWPAVQP